MYRNALAALVLLGCASSADAIVVTGANPNDPLYQSPATGVSFLSIAGGGACSGALLGTGQHILTAAHCVVNASGPNAANARFETGLGTFNYTSTNILFHPSYNNANILAGFDIAIIYLGLTVDASIDRYPIFTNTNELGQVGIVAGWGREGTGATGGEGGSSGNGRRQGENEIDQILNGNILLFDFDNGLDPQNSLGGTGRGNLEVSTYRGDSGGPTFVGGQIAGIHSFISCVVANPGDTTCQSPPDIDTAINGTFGERFGDTRVSNYTDWINGAIADVPEPGTYVTAFAGLAAILLRARKQRG